MFLVVEDSPPVSRVIERVLRKFGDVHVAESVSDGLKALESIGAIDALVVDVGLPDGTGFDVLEAARARRSDLPCLVLTGQDDHPTIKQAQLVGAEYLPKPTSPKHLEAFGERCVAPVRRQEARLDELVESVASKHRLSRREAQIVRLTAAGVAPSELASEMQISENTVKTLTRRLLRKCGANRVTDLTAPLQRRMFGVPAL